MGEGVEVRCPARGVEAEQGVSRHSHVQIPFEDPCEDASVPYPFPIRSLSVSLGGVGGGVC